MTSGPMSRIVLFRGARAGVVAGALAFVSLPLISVAQEAEKTPLYVAIAGVGGSISTLTIAYPSDPGVEQAQEDRAALSATGNWTVSELQRAETPDGVLYEGQISPAVALDAAGQVPYFPVLWAFRRYPRIKFSFVGEAAGPPGQYHDENRYVAAEWTRGGRSVTYEFRIKDPSFRQAEDVRLVDRPADEPLPPPTPLPSGGRHVAALWALLVVGSIGTGVFIWGLTWWLLTRWQSTRGVAGEVIGDLEANQGASGETGY